MEQALIILAKTGAWQFPTIVMQLTGEGTDKRLKCNYVFITVFLQSIFKK